MSKYGVLWNYVQKRNESSFKLTFDEIGKISGIPLDHSFLTYKKELKEFEFEVIKVSLKEKTVEFRKLV